MSTLVVSVLAHVVILGACAFLLGRSVRNPSIIVFAVAATLRCLALAPAIFIGKDTQTVLPVLEISRVANLCSLVLFPVGFVMLAAWLVKVRARQTADYADERR